MNTIWILEHKKNIIFPTLNCFYHNQKKKSNSVYWCCSNYQEKNWNIKKKMNKQNKK